jgi:hypothetical protein
MYKLMNQSKVTKGGTHDKEKKRKLLDKLVS